MRKTILFLVSILLVFLFASCSHDNLQAEENVEIMLQDDLQSLYSEIILTHDFHDISSDFSCTLIYKAYGIYSVDLSDAIVSTTGNIVRVTLPPARLAHFGIKDEDFEILDVKGDIGWKGHILNGGESRGIDMAEEERSLIENEARELLSHDHFINKANDLAIKNVTSLIESVNKRINGLQIFVNIEE